MNATTSAKNGTHARNTKSKRHPVEPANDGTRVTAEDLAAHDLRTTSGHRYDEKHQNTIADLLVDALDGGRSASGINLHDAIIAVANDLAVFRQAMSSDLTEEILEASLSATEKRLRVLAELHSRTQEVEIRALERLAALASGDAMVRQ